MRSAAGAIAATAATAIDASGSLSGGATFDGADRLRALLAQPGCSSSAR